MPPGIESPSLNYFVSFIIGATHKIQIFLSIDIRCPRCNATSSMSFEFGAKVVYK